MMNFVFLKKEIFINVILAWKESIEICASDYDMSKSNYYPYLWIKIMYSTSFLLLFLYTGEDQVVSAESVEIRVETPLEAKGLSFKWKFDLIFVV